MGVTEGEPVGLIVGDLLGLLDGLSDGAREGDKLGLVVGETVGLSRHIPQVEAQYSFANLVVQGWGGETIWH